MATTDPKILALMMQDNDNTSESKEPQKDGDDPVPITNEHRKAWNDFQNYLSKKGLAGSPELDKGGKGLEVLNQYRKENPNTPLNKDMILPIQKDFQNYRQWALDDIKKGNGAFAPGVNEGNFMKELSVVDGIPGQLTSKHQFPMRYMSSLDQNGSVVKKENLGFAANKQSGFVPVK